MNPADALVWYIAFVISVTAHEAAHAAAALLGGDRTAYLGGQVSLNPVPHIRREPFGMVVVPALFAFLQGWPLGWASTPYDPAWEQNYPRRAAWMAAAGPGANLLLAVISLILLRAGLDAGHFYPADPVFFSREGVQLVGADTQFLFNAGRFLSMMLILNVILFLFNLIPFPPLDGAAMLGLVLPEDLGMRVRQLLSGAGVALVGLLLAWMLFPSVIGPTWEVLLRLVHPEIEYR